ncbi:MAG: hypothetical protein GF383_16535 [Candidatus Lokiarchaeota archaeon]|nr:hypothetical protein [Candidatus Lokiarchaeota archaeon]MBD3343391.1 hypothetical protein [Candidatus Lokiarchaeota archaeon]
MTCAYLGPALNFIMIIIINTPLNQYAYFAILGLCPLTAVFFTTAIVDILVNKPKNRNIITFVIWLYCLITMSIYYYLLFTNITQIGIFRNPYVIVFSLFTQLYILIILVIFIATGLVFTKSCFKSKQTEIRLQAILLIVAFISLTIGVIMTLIVEYIVIILGMMILALRAILFYMGYIFPEWTKKLFLKKASD